MKTAKDIIALIDKNAMMRFEAEIQEDVSLTDQGFDSLDRVTLFFEIEERFGVKIPPTKSADMHSINDIVEFLNAEYYA